MTNCDKLLQAVQMTRAELLRDSSASNRSPGTLPGARCPGDFLLGAPTSVTQKNANKKSSDLFWNCCFKRVSVALPQTYASQQECTEAGNVWLSPNANPMQAVASFTCKYVTQ